MQNEIKQKVWDFLSDTNTIDPKIIVIYGPTACGKTGLSLDIALFLREEWLVPHIISADSRQIYRGMDIGTGKITHEEMQWIPHHMIDIIDPSEAFSVVDFRNRVENLDMWKSWRWGDKNIVPIICGGTGLYLDSLVLKRTYPTIEADWELRADLEKIRVEQWNKALWKILDDMDKEYAKILHPNNYRYVMRGIEVFKKSGQSKLEITDEQKCIFDTLFLTPYDWDRVSLYEKINIRVSEMFKTWLIDEVRYILDNLSRGVLQKSNKTHCPWLATIGYAEVVEYIEWTISLDECVSLVQQHNRNYAKRQITWNKKYEPRWNYSWI